MHCENKTRVIILNRYNMDKSLNVKNFAAGCYGVFENGLFITSRDEFDKMIEQATMIANEGKSTVTISTLNFAGNEEQPTIIEGTVIMKFYKVYDTVYISNQLD